MKTINILTYYFIPENTAATNRVLTMVEMLSKKYKINVIATTEKGKPQQNGKIKYNENVNIYYIDQKMYDGEKFYTRAVHELYYSTRIALKSLKLKSDITITTAPSMFLIPMVAMLVRGKKILDIRDLVWEYMAAGSLYSKILKHQISKLMKFSIRAFDAVTATNDHEIEWVQANTNISNLVKITNGIEQANFKELSRLHEVQNEKFTITYVGNVGIAQNLEVLVEVGRRLKDIQVFIVGSGNRYDPIKKYLHKKQIDNVTLFGKIPREKMQEYYAQSSVLFAQLGEKFHTAMPSKLYEYASTGLPIIYAGVGEARHFVEKLDGCLTIDPGNVDQLEKAIVEIKNREQVIKEKNREFIQENFIRETQSQKMVDLVDKLL